MPSPGRSHARRTNCLTRVRRRFRTLCAKLPSPARAPKTSRPRRPRLLPHLRRGFSGITTSASGRITLFLHFRLATTVLAEASRSIRICLIGFVVASAIFGLYGEGDILIPIGSIHLRMHRNVCVQRRYGPLLADVHQSSLLRFLRAIEISFLLCQFAIDRNSLPPLRRAAQPIPRRTTLFPRFRLCSHAQVDSLPHVKLRAQPATRIARADQRYLTGASVEQHVQVMPAEPLHPHTALSANSRLRIQA